MRRYAALAAGDAREARPFAILFAIIGCLGIGIAVAYKGPDSYIAPSLLLTSATFVGAVLGGVSIPSGPRAGVGMWTACAPLSRGPLWVWRCLRCLVLFAVCWCLPSVVAVLVATPSGEWNADTASVLASLTGGALACLSALLIAHLFGVHGRGIIAGLCAPPLAQAAVVIVGGAVKGPLATAFMGAAYRRNLDPDVYHAVTYNIALLTLAMVIGGAFALAGAPALERALRATRAIGYLALCAAAALPLSLALGAFQEGLLQREPAGPVGGIAADPTGTYLTFCTTRTGSQADGTTWWAMKLPDGELRRLVHNAKVVRWQPQVAAFGGIDSGTRPGDGETAFLLRPGARKRVLGEFPGYHSPISLLGAGGVAGAPGGSRQLRSTTGPGGPGAGLAAELARRIPGTADVRTQLWVAPNGEAVAARNGDEQSPQWAYALPPSMEIDTGLAFPTQFLAWSADGKAAYLAPASGAFSGDKAQIVRIGPRDHEGETVIDLEGEFETVVHRDRRLVALSTGRLFGLGRAGGRPWAEGMSTRHRHDAATGWIVDLESGRKTAVTDLGEVVGMAFSPDGKLLAGVAEAAGEKRICIRLYDVAAGALTRTLESPWRRLPVGAGGGARSPLLAGAGSPRPAATLQTVHPWLPNVSRVEEVPVDFSSAQWSPDGRYLLLWRGLGGGEPALHIWDTATDAAPATVDVLRDKPWRFVGWSVDSRLVLALPTTDPSPVGLGGPRLPEDAAGEIALVDPATGSMQTLLRTADHQSRAGV